MQYISSQILSAIVDEMAKEFDTHSFLQKLMRPNDKKGYAREYIQELTSLINTPDPFLSLHQKIGEELLSVNRIRPIGKVRSLNIRGNKTLNEKWQKL